MKKVLLLSLLFLFFCGETPSLWGQTSLVFEDFENVPTDTLPPPGWSRTQAATSYGFEFGTAIDLGTQLFPIPFHSRFACSNDDAHDDQTTNLNNAFEDRLISPVLDLTPYASDGVICEFDVFNPGTVGSDGYLEYSTNGGVTWVNIDTFPKLGVWQTLSYSLTALTSFSTLQLAFRHDDHGAWAEGVAFDNISIRSVPGNEVELTTIDLKDYELAGNLDVSGTLTNNGNNSINTVQIAYSINGGTAIVETLTNLNLNLGDVHAFTHSTPANLQTPGIYSLEVSVSNPNLTGPDSDPSNDTILQEVSVLSAVPVKRVIVQDFTGAWCQFCPDATIILDSILGQNPQVIGVAIHVQDAMEIREGDTLATTYINSYPAGAIDLTKFPDQPVVELDRFQWEQKALDRLNQVVPVAVSIEDQEFDPVSRLATLTVKADFTGTVNDELRLNLWVTENGVTGIGSGFDQVNAFDAQVGHPYFGAGNPIAGFVHDHTLRYIAGGTWGLANSIPGPIVDGYSASTTFSYSIPPSVDEEEVNLIPIVQQYDLDINKRPILNSVEIPLETEVGIAPELITAGSFQVYPNPFQQETHIEFDLKTPGHISLQIFDLLGRPIATLNNSHLELGKHSFLWDGANPNGTAVGKGFYFLVLETQNQRVTRILQVMN